MGSELFSAQRGHEEGPMIQHGLQQRISEVSGAPTFWHCSLFRAKVLHFNRFRTQVALETSPIFMSLQIWGHAWAPLRALGLHWSELSPESFPLGSP